MAEIEDVQSWVGADAVDPSDEKLGKVEEVLLDSAGEPAFASVKSGLISKHHFVPLRGATFGRGHVRFAYGKDQVHSAPGAGSGGIRRGDAAVLHRHYGLESATDAGNPDELTYETAGAVAERRRLAQDQLDHAADLERQAAARADDSQHQAATATRSREAASEAAAEARRLQEEAAQARAAAERDLER